MFRIDNELKEKFMDVRRITLDELAVQFGNDIVSLSASKKVEEYKKLREILLNAIPTNDISKIEYSEGAQLILEDAMENAYLDGRDTINKEDLVKAIQNDDDANLIKKFIEETDDDLTELSTHEAGHVLMVLYSKMDYLKILAVSIIPREGAMGETFYKLTRDVEINERQYLERIRLFLAGKIATDIMGINSGKKYHKQDAISASMLAFEYVEKYRKNCKDKKLEISKIIQQAAAEAIVILKMHIEELKTIVEALKKERVILSDQLEALLSNKNSSSKL